MPGSASEPQGDADDRQRLTRMWEFVAARKPPDVAWAQVFDLLTPEDVAELAGIYDTLPEAARSEFDRRYGSPGAPPFP